MKTIYYPNTQKSSPLTYWFTNQISVFVPDYSRAYNETLLKKLWPLLPEPLSQSRKLHLAAINVRMKLVRPFWVTPRVDGFKLNAVCQPRQRSWLKGQHYTIKFIFAHFNHFSIGWSDSKHPSIGPRGQTPLPDLTVWIRKWDTTCILQ